MKVKIPSGLKTPGRKFYKKVLEEYELPETHDLERLFMAAKCIDEIADDEKTVKEEGRFIEDRFNQKREHPASKAIRDNKTLFCRIIRELGLDLATAQESRIPGRY